MQHPPKYRRSMSLAGRKFGHASPDKLKIKETIFSFQFSVLSYSEGRRFNK
jgi:hypothetical protein